MEKLKIVNMSEIADRGAKQSEIWDLGVLIQHIWGYL